MQQTRRARVVASGSLPEPEVVVSSRSNSPLRSLYESRDFRVAYDNEIAFHVSRNAIHLRRYRGMSQAEVAGLMHTSQSKVARIEGGDENITLNTLKKLAVGLRGRLRLAIEPMELVFPSVPTWWEAISLGLASQQVWQVHRVMTNCSGSQAATRAGVLWSTDAVKKEVTLNALGAADWPALGEEDQVAENGL